ARVAAVDSTSANLEREIFAVARARHGAALERLATRVHPMNRWADLVLPEEPRSQLRELVERVAQAPVIEEARGFARHLPRTRGVSVLFSGASGTGKTMAAEIIAGEIGLDLFRIDLASIVSKYIGETEKNLDRLFEAAVGSNGVLFFDEADAIF